MCGAPKINPYKSPYIMCDYCGNFTDIDHTMGLQAWNSDPKRTDKYQKASMNIQAKLAEHLKNKQKKEYYDLQVSYWDVYYKFYPEYLPPTMHFDDKNYPVYLDVCADYSTEAAFDKNEEKKARELASHQKRIEYIKVNGTTKVKGDSFFRMVNFYIDYMKDSFKFFYENPKYAIMHQLLPPETHLKMKTSMLVQAWLPYLTETDAKRFLSETNFTDDYAELPEVKGEDKRCEHCKVELFIPENALKVYCESCHKTNIIKSNFNCVSCGSENEIPEVPVNTLNCKSCAVENRLITAQFG